VDPETKIIEGNNRITVVKIKFSKKKIYDVEFFKCNDDFNQFRNLIIDNQMYEIYKYMKVKSLKRTLIFNLNMHGQWPDIVDAGNGTIYKDEEELNDVGAFLMTVWHPIMPKKFKLKVEGSIICNVNLNRETSICEVRKSARKLYGLAKDSVIADGNGLVYQDYENALQYKDNLWLARNRTNKVAKNGEFHEVRVTILTGEISLHADAKIYSLWNREAVVSYINQLTGLNDKYFVIEINGTNWLNNLSFGSMKPKSVRIGISQQRFTRRILNIVNCDMINIQAINFKVGEEYKTFTGPKNISLGEAIAFWSLLGLNFPSFDYILVDGRRMNEYEYNVEKLDYWT
jgi:hypothetical protein